MLKKLKITLLLLFIIKSGFSLEWAVYFNKEPFNNNLELVMAELINKAEKTIDLQMYAIDKGLIRFSGSKEDLQQNDEIKKRYLSV